MLIHRVTGVTVFALPLVFVKTWLVVARGETATSGWTNGRLVPQSDGDGLITLHFEADQPTGINLQVLTPIVTSITVQPTNGIKGVRVQGSTNEIVKFAPIYRAAGSGEEQDGDFGFLDYETEFNDLGYEPADGEVLASAVRSEAATLALVGKTCDRKRLFKVISRVEFKTSGWKFYRRERYLSTFLKYCYPDDIADAAIESIKDCLPPAIAAGVAAAAGGPPAAVSAFVAAMKLCVGAELGSKVSVGIDTDEEVGSWHRI